MYLSSTPKLFDLSQQIMDRLLLEIPRLHAHLFEHQIFLEVMLAGPLMTLFSNLVSFTESTHILTLFILDGESFIMDLIINIYRNIQDKILKMNDSFEIQAYLSKDMFEDALNSNLFY